MCFTCLFRLGVLLLLTSFTTASAQVAVFRPITSPIATVPVVPGGVSLIPGAPVYVARPVLVPSAITGPVLSSPVLATQPPATAGQVSVFRPALPVTTFAPSPVYQAMRPITVPAAGSPVAANPVSSFYAPAGPLVASPQLAPIPLAPATGVVATGVILLPRYVPGQPLRNVVRAFAP